jgi:sugar-specific transcriptional regulator TrmB
MQLLLKIGLTSCQAKIYLANLQSGPSTAKVISSISKIAREDVYRALPSLQEKGLITKWICFPELFEALPFKEGVSVLLRIKKEELSELREESDSFLEKFDEKFSNYGKNFGEYTIKFHSKSNAADDTFTRYTKNSVLFTTTYTNFVHLANSLKYELIWKEMYLALKRGVKYKVLLDRPKNGPLINELSFSLKYPGKIIRHENFEYRYTSFIPETIFALYDEKHSAIWSSSERFYLEPLIMTNYPSLINMTKVTFFSLWEKAQAT